jgi:hypothetical protein
MYSLASVRAAIEDPRSAVGELNRIYDKGLGFRESRAFNREGIDVLSADWDRLVILDACRFDTFQDMAGDLEGALHQVESKASATAQFLRANFTDRDATDTVYVTANPQLYRIENGIYDVDPINVEFHEQIEVWQDQWDDDHRTVLPDVVTDAALEAAERFPNKRIIVHYLQPHAPYIGMTGKNELPTEYLNFWGAFRDGEFDVNLETVERAYRENLELVMPHVEQLCEEFDGKTVLTADHGELLGDRDQPIPIKRYGHPAFTHLPGLVEVPWFVNVSEPRPDIVAEAPADTTQEGDYDSDVVKERLKDLGYA